MLPFGYHVSINLLITNIINVYITIILIIFYKIILNLYLFIQFLNDLL